MRQLVIHLMFVRRLIIWFVRRLVISLFFEAAGNIIDACEVVGNILDVCEAGGNNLGL